MCHVSGVMCYVSFVRCQVSHVMCHVPHITCHMSPVTSTCHMSLTPTATATDPPSANSSTLRRRLVRKDTWISIYFFPPRSFSLFLSKQILRPLYFRKFIFGSVFGIWLFWPRASENGQQKALQNIFLAKFTFSVKLLYLLNQTINFDVL